jgi:hypothetical protein
MNVKLKLWNITNGIYKEAKNHCADAWKPLARTPDTHGVKSLAKDVFTNSDNLKKVAFRIMHLALAAILITGTAATVTLAMIKFPVIMSSLILAAGITIAGGLLLASSSKMIAKLVEKVLAKINEKKV